MKLRSIFTVSLAIALLAVGCNSNKGVTNNPASNDKDSGTQSTPPLEELIAHNPGVPTGFVPYEGDGYRLLIPTTWSRKAGVDANHFTLSNNSSLSVAQTGGVVMDISLVSKSTQTDIKDVVATLVKGQQNVTKLTEGFTNSGLKMVSVSYGPSKSAITLYAVELTKQNYIKVGVSGATQDPYVKAVVTSFVSRGQ